MTTLHVNLESCPEGTELEVSYLGLFENGGSYELTEAQVVSYEGNTGEEIPDVLNVGDPEAELPAPVVTEDMAANPEADTNEETI